MTKTKLRNTAKKVIRPKTSVITKTISKPKKKPLEPSSDSFTLNYREAVQIYKEERDQYWKRRETILIEDTKKDPLFEIKNYPINIEKLERIPEAIQEEMKEEKIWVKKICPPEVYGEKKEDKSFPKGLGRGGKARRQQAEIDAYFAVEFSDEEDTPLDKKEEERKARIEKRDIIEKKQIEEREKKKREYDDSRVYYAQVPSKSSIGDSTIYEKRQWSEPIKQPKVPVVSKIQPKRTVVLVPPRKEGLTPLEIEQKKKEALMRRAACKKKREEERKMDVV